MTDPRNDVSPGASGFSAEGVSEEQVSDILAGWRQRLRGSPDLQPREGLRGQRERSLTKALLAAADARRAGPPADEEALRKLAMVAALYGAEQPRDRLDPGALCEELGHLRQAVWHHLRRDRLDREVVTERILAFDRALSIALRAALTGGFRCEPDRFPEFQQSLDAIVSESVAPPERAGAGHVSAHERREPEPH